MKHGQKRFDTLIWIRKQLVFLKDLWQDRLGPVKSRTVLRHSSLIEQLRMGTEFILNPEQE